MEKYTPGPWVVSTAWADENERFSIKTDNETLKVGPDNGLAVCFVGWINNPEAQANARLLAAAPELLEALGFAIALFKAQGVDKNHRIFGANLIMMENAYKKATI